MILMMLYFLLLVYLSANIAQFSHLATTVTTTFINTTLKSAATRRGEVEGDNDKQLSTMSSCLEYDVLRNKFPCG